MNNVIGEIEVKICDQTFQLKPTFKGLCEIESRSGTSLSRLINKILKGNISIHDITSIIYGGIVGYGKSDTSFDALGNLIVQHGVSRLLETCATFVGAGFSGIPIEEIDSSDIKKKTVDS